MKEKKLLANKENIWNCIGILIGIAAIVVGIIIFFNTRGWEWGDMDRHSYGADFYTDIYTAVSSVAGRVYGNLTMVRDGVIPALCFMISFAGCITSILFARRITHNIQIQNDKCTEKNTSMLEESPHNKAEAETQVEASPKEATVCSNI